MPSLVEKTKSTVENNIENIEKMPSPVNTVENIEIHYQEDYINFKTEAIKKHRYTPKILKVDKKSCLIMTSYDSFSKNDCKLLIFNISDNFIKEIVLNLDNFQNCQEIVVNNESCTKRNILIKNGSKELKRMFFGAGVWPEFSNPEKIFLKRLVVHSFNKYNFPVSTIFKIIGPLKDVNIKLIVCNELWISNCYTMLNVVDTKKKNIISPFQWSTLILDFDYHKTTDVNFFLEKLNIQNVRLGLPLMLDEFSISGIYKYDMFDGQKTKMENEEYFKYNEQQKHKLERPYPVFVFHDLNKLPEDTITEIFQFDDL